MSIEIVVFFVTFSPNRCYHDRRSPLDWCRGWGACEPKRIRSKPDGKTHIDPAFVSSMLAGLESSRQFHGCRLSRHPPNAIYKCLALWMFLKQKVRGLHVSNDVKTTNLFFQYPHCSEQWLEARAGVPPMCRRAQSPSGPASRGRFVKMLTLP